MTRRPKRRPPRTPNPPQPSGAGKVVVAYCHPGEVAARFHTSIIDLIIHDTFDGKQRIVSGGGHFAMRSGANITSARNDLVAMFLDHHNAEWLLMVDADMTFDRDTVDRLVEAADPAERPIVGALCFGVWEGSEQTDLFPTIYYWTDNPRGVARAIDYPDNTVFQIGATGAACILIHRGVLEQMRERYPGPWHWYQEQIFDGRPMSEDITFCLRAAAMGLPVHVHTGVKTGHVKHQILDERAYSMWRSRQQEPAFVICGTGRSGSQYIAHVLRQVGVNCGHEDWWNPYNKHTPDLDGDSSWMAVPFLHTYGGRVFHQIRDPIQVIQSLLNKHMTDPENIRYLQFADLHTPDGYTGNLDSTVRMVAWWLQTADEKAELTWRLEDVTPQLIVDICRRINRPISLQQAEAAVQAIPTNLNDHGAKPDIGWADLPDLPETAFLKAWAERWGYQTGP